MGWRYSGEGQREAGEQNGLDGLAVLQKGTKQSVIVFWKVSDFFFFFVNGSPPCWEKKNPTCQTNP